MAITTMDGLVSALNSGKIYSIYKPSLTSKASGNFHSFWKAVGLPVAGANPGSVNGIIPTNTTVGALNQTNPGGTNKSYLAKLSLSCTTIGTIILYDRLWTNSTLNGTSITAQTFTMPALTRYTDGVGLELWAEWYTATGSTAVTATASYTNTLDVAGKSATASFIASPVAGQMIPFTMASGDLGIKSVQSVTLSATTGTAGDFGLTLLKRIGEIPIITANAGLSLDSFTLGMPEIVPNACLAFMVLCSTTSTGILTGSSVIIEG